MLQTAPALALVTQDLVRGLAAEGLMYAELRFAPMLHLEAGLRAEQAVEAVLGAAADAASATGVGVGVILSTLRHFDQSSSARTAHLARKYSGQGVVGFDLAGDEAGYPLTPHVSALREAQESGVGVTVHAGEGAGPESIREVMAALSPSRIGHGVRAVEDDELVAELASRGTHLELCPACNVQLGLYPSLRDHPIDRLRSAGVSVSISTDSRTSTPTTLRAQHDELRAAFGWSPSVLTELTRNAIDAAFLSELERRRLLDRLYDEP